MNLSKSQAFVIFLFTLFLTGFGCTSAKREIKRLSTSYTAEHLFQNQFTGLTVFDPETRDTLVCHNCQKYFTPASNTKILSLYAGLELLPDSLPALIYGRQSDTLYFKGTGYPASLHPELKDSLVYHFLKAEGHLALYSGNAPLHANASGWAWDDFDQGYTPEMSALPVYGNQAIVYKEDPPRIFPDFYTDSLFAVSSNWRRDFSANRFYHRPGDPDTVTIPIKASPYTTRMLWQFALDKTVHGISQLPEIPMDTLYGLPADSIYRPMMHQSDNFLAEQILLMVSSRVSDTLSIAAAVAVSLDSLLPDLKQPPRWVDGSGLSRYNLVSPQSLVDVLSRLYHSQNRERLLSFFPAGGVHGTLESWYAGDTEPYVYAKTGSLGNNHNLSGYLKTKSGKLLIFSIMNNHYRIPTEQLKLKMQAYLEGIRAAY